MALDKYKENYENNYSFVPPLFLYTELLKAFNKKKYDYILKSSDIHKLTIKIGKGDNYSFFGKIIKEYEIV